jgi:YHS domain-containing protein
MATSTNHELFIDPVCGKQVDSATAAARTCYNGIQIYFCAEECQTAFEAEPQNYTLNQNKGFWRRYLDRLGKDYGGRPPACH